MHSKNTPAPEHPDNLDAPSHSPGARPFDAPTREDMLKRARRALYDAFIMAQLENLGAIHIAEYARRTGRSEAGIWQDVLSGKLMAHWSPYGDAMIVEEDW